MERSTLLITRNKEAEGEEERRAQEAQAKQKAKIGGTMQYLFLAVIIIASALFIYYENRIAMTDKEAALKYQEKIIRRRRK